MVSQMVIVDSPTWISPCIVEVSGARFPDSNSFIAELPGYEPERFRIFINAGSPMYRAWARGDLGRNDIDIEYQIEEIDLRPNAETRLHQQAEQQQKLEYLKAEREAEEKSRKRQREAEQKERERREELLSSYFKEDYFVRLDLEEPRDWIDLGMEKSSVDERLRSAFVKTHVILETSDGLAIKYYYTLGKHPRSDEVIPINSSPPYSGLTIYYRLVQNKWHVLDWSK